MPSALGKLLLAPMVAISAGQARHAFSPIAPRTINF
jgi:hypothetical protein